MENRIALEEQLREALFSAEQSWERERTLRKQYGTLVHGVNRMSRAKTLCDLFATVVQTVAGTIPSDTCLVFQGSVNAPTAQVTAATDETLSGTTIPVNNEVWKLVGARPVIVYDVSTSALKPVIAAMGLNAATALVAELYGGDRPYVLVAVSGVAGAITREHARFVSDFTPVIRESVVSRIAEQQLRDTERQLMHAQKLESIGQLAAGVAHEINNPVGFVQSNFHSLTRYVESLLVRVGECDLFTIPDGMTPDEFRTEIRTILKENAIGLDRVKSIVDTLRDFARASAGTDYVEAEINEAIVTTLTIAGYKTKHVLTVHLDLGPLPPVQCNIGQLNQVFLNLIVNAAQAVGTVSQRGNLWIRTRTRRDEVILDFTDDGPGIPPDQQTRIFDPFFTTRPVGEGTGLGLSVSADIIREHHGTITVENAPDRGAHFSIRLPVVQSR